MNDDEASAMQSQDAPLSH